jgi:uncharacterized protein YdaU (DUF1376 family)
MNTKPQEPRHFDFVPADFTGDIDFQTMTAEERGVFCTIIFYMYQNKGYCNLDNTSMATLCGCSNNFDRVWEKIKNKFIHNSGGLTHKRVISEYSKSLQRMQTSVKAGVKGAKRRWGGHKGSHEENNSHPTEKKCLSKVKENKDISPLPPAKKSGGTGGELPQAPYHKPFEYTQKPEKVCKVS